MSSSGACESPLLQGQDLNFYFTGFKIHGNVWNWFISDPRCAISFDYIFVVISLLLLLSPSLWLLFFAFSSLTGCLQVVAASCPAATVLRGVEISLYSKEGGAQAIATTTTDNTGTTFVLLFMLPPFLPLLFTFSVPSFASGAYMFQNVFPGQYTVKARHPQWTLSSDSAEVKMEWGNARVQEPFQARASALVLHAHVQAPLHDTHPMHVTRTNILYFVLCMPFSFFIHFSHLYLYLRPHRSPALISLAMCSLRVSQSRACRCCCTALQRRASPAKSAWRVRETRLSTLSL